jgi:hypothetical protein
LTTPASRPSRNGRKAARQVGDDVVEVLDPGEEATPAGADAPVSPPRRGPVLGMGRETRVMGGDDHNVLLAVHLLPPL